MAIDPTRRPRQRYLGNRGLIMLIALFSAFVPLSTDLYLPALPGMAEFFNAPADLTNLTLVLFFVFFSFGTLLWGPLSDKYERKPILLIGLVIYVIASILCAAAWDIYHLNFTSWRGVFWALASVGLLALAGSIALEETIDKRYYRSTLEVIGRLGTVLRNPGFSSLLSGC